MSEASIMRRVLFFLLCFCSATLAADDVCLTCHGDMVAARSGSIHDTLSCNTCHVGGEAHAAAPGKADTVLSFHDEPAHERSAACQTCHADVRPPTTGNPHDQAGVACNDCHSAHGQSALEGLEQLGLGRLTESSASCHGCHQDVFAEFELSEHHRLGEGTITCVSCHDPHGTELRRHLGGFKQSQCASCHADTDGPFVFEHAASRAEGCGACHVPHGSPNRHLLTHQREGELCYSCHAMVPEFHLGFSPVAPPRFDEDTVCSNCHVTVHGSNIDRNFLR